ncbi:MAG: GNAT family N-acetyltransferase [Solirubrobacteraceae bacterium]
MAASAAESQTPLVRDVLLRDGSTLRLQAPTPVDYDQIKAFYDGLSPDSHYFRFHGFGRTDTVARADAEASGVDRLALIGRHDDHVVAVSVYDGLREPGVAEVAIAVADHDQRRGIGMRMLEQLAAIAAGRGIHRFDAEVMFSNRAALDLLNDVGFAVRRKGFGELTVSLDITPTETAQARIDERDHVASVASLRPILAPASIAVMGAADAPGNIGRVVLQNIIAGGFRGAVRPVNRTGGVVCSMQAARSLAELEVAPELVIITAAGDDVLEFAAEAAANGVKALLVLPAGREDGDAARAREERLLEIVRGGGLRMVGPSSLGVLNTAAEVSLNATFTGASVRAGALAIGSPSGAVGIGLLGHAASRQLGVSTFASLGSRADVSTNDLLECWEQNDRAGVVILYVETFGNPERFTRIARRVSRRKPILVVKGRRRAERVLSEARSHTAAALRGDAVIDALLREAGVLRFRGIEELFSAADFFERQPLPSGRRIGIVSNSEGVATLAADACATGGLQVREASDAQNPLLLEINAGPEEYGASLRALLGDAGIDALMVFYVDFHEGDPEAVLNAISGVSAGQPKPVVASVLRSDGQLPARSGVSVPNYLFPESCAAVLTRAVERREWLARPLGEPPHYPDLDPAAARAAVASVLDRAPAGGWLSLADAEALLATYGIPIAASHHCLDLERAVAVAAQIGAAVTLKADSPAPATASDIDAVLVGLQGESALRSGWRELKRRVHAAGRQWNGAIIQRLPAPGGSNVLVGAVSDPDLGPVLAVGLGGRHAGLARGAECRLLPVTDAEADELIDSSEGVVAELDGFRGSALLDREALRELILRFALLLREVPELVETDLNPVRCMTNGCVVLDMRLRLEPRRPVARVKTW